MTATLEQPIEKQTSVDVYLWQSWHQASAFMGSLSPYDAMRELCVAADGWKNLGRMAVKKKSFSEAVLSAMRKLMALPEPYPEYWKHNPWIDPTQDWVADQVRDFVKWHLQKVGEPNEDGSPKIEQPVDTTKT